MSQLPIERTLAVIKPLAVKHAFHILRRIFSTFHILQERCVKLSAAQAEEFFQYQQRNDIHEWSSGPLIALCLAREDAIDMWKKLMGPEDYSIAKEISPPTLRALYGSNGTNPLYGTDSVAHAQRELRFFFPTLSFEYFPTSNDDINNYLGSSIYQPLTDALYEMIQIKPDEPIEFIANYMLMHQVKQPIMQSACPDDTVHLLQQLKNENKPKERDEQKNRKAKCGCSVTSASSLSST